jgi:hypothetical protein
LYTGFACEAEAIWMWITASKFLGQLSDTNLSAAQQLFDIFVIDGRSYIDDNGGRHYLVPDLLKRTGIA